MTCMFKKLLMTLASLIVVSTTWIVSASATPVVVDWNPSIHPYGANQPWNVPYPARSTDPSLLTGGVLDTVGIVNDSLNHGWAAFTFKEIPNAFSEDHYLTFTLSPAASKQAILSTLNLVTDISQVVGDYILRTSLDGFASDITGFVSFGPNSQNYQGISFDLSGLPSITSLTTFHLHVSDSFQNDNFSLIYGSVAAAGRGLWFGEADVIDYTPPSNGGGVSDVPEPNMILLMGMGLIGLGLSRRRRSH